MPRFEQQRSTPLGGSRCRVQTARCLDRRAAAAVEFAVVFPIFLLLVFGAIDIGRAIIVQHKLAEAARAGCRLYLVKNEVTQDEARQMVDDVMSEAHLEGYNVRFDPPDSADIEHLAPVTVEVTIPEDRVAWMNAGWFMPGSTLSGTCIMPGDTGEVNHTGTGNGNTNGNGDGGGGGHSGSTGNSGQGQNGSGNGGNGGNGSNGSNGGYGGNGGYGNGGGGFWGWLWRWFTR